jgi:hypothetical protein
MAIQMSRSGAQIVAPWFFRRSSIQFHASLSRAALFFRGDCAKGVRDGVVSQIICYVSIGYAVTVGNILSVALYGSTGLTPGRQLSAKGLSRVSSPPGA